MGFVQFSNISLAFGDRDILKDEALDLSKESKSALAGANGSGKTTLMKVMAGLMEADSGERAIAKGTRISYLPQSGIIHRGRTLGEELERAFASLDKFFIRIGELEQQLADVSEGDSKTDSLLEELYSLQESVRDSGWYTKEASISRVLMGLGFKMEDIERPVEEFSGGWQMRIALAKVLLENPDILLLDEPTNYLDIEARQWLEVWLADFKGGYLLVSHDRHFLDISTREVYEIFQGRLRRYTGNYSDYEKQRKVELESLIARHEAQNEEIAKMEDFIRRFRATASRAALVQDRIKRLEKMERIEIPANLQRMRMEIPPSPPSGRSALQLRGLGKSWGDLEVFKNLDLDLDAGERLLVVGKNGAGKSTLLRILAQEDGDYTGKITYGTGIRTGYFSQDAAEQLQSNKSVLDWLEGNAPTDLIPRVRDLLGAFLFRGDDVFKPVSVLSGGEKSRLSLLALLLHPFNLLILDEPTNHLDLHAKDILLEALQNYSGTLIFVSHDQAFMEALSTKTLALSPAGTSDGGNTDFVASTAKQSHRLFTGNYAYYLERLAREGASVQASKQGADPCDISSKNIEEAGSGKNENFRREQKRLQAEKKRLEREEEALLNTIARLEEDLALCMAEIQKPEVYSDGEKSREYMERIKTLEEKIAEKSEDWERLGLGLEAVENNLAALYTDKEIV